MTRDDFYNDCLARYIREGMAMAAAKARASAVTCSHWPISAYSQADAAADRLIHEANREWAER